VASSRLRVTSGRWDMTLCSGGHPLPLLVREAVPPTSVGEPGALLGVLDAPSLHDSELVLQQGDRLVFFTDGVTEGRRGRDFYGDERLQAAAAGHGSAEQVVDRILEDVLRFQDGVSSDDIAIVAVRVP
jgi:sigma-B regulation protein RsbU (phosphoserine phosphatase)